MKKNLIILFELTIYILLACMLGLYLNEIYSSIKNYSVTQGIGIETIIILITIIFIFLLILSIFLLIALIKLQKKRNIKGVYLSVSNVFKSHKLIAIFTFFSVFILLFVYVTLTFQNLFIYYPNHAYSAEMNLIELDKYEKINILTEEGKKTSGWAKIDENNEYTVIYFGGNAQSSAMFFTEQNASDWDYLYDYNIVMVDYPGYGLSEGIPNEQSICEMALVVYDFVYQMTNVDNTKIIIMGFSLGTGVATHVASNRDIHKLILIAPYTTLIDVINTKVPIFYGPFRWLIRSEFNIYNRVSNLEIEMLLVYSKSDKVIKASLSKRVAESVTNPVVHVEEHLRHNEILSSHDVLETIRFFINS